MDNVVTTKTIDEGSFEKVPKFYKSASGNPFIGRFDDKLETESDTPKLTEVIEGSFILLEDGSNAVKTERVVFQKLYQAAPFIDGIVWKPTDKVVSIPNYEYDGDFLIVNDYLSFQSLTNFYVDLKYSIANTDYVGASVRYKLLIYDLSVR